MKFNIEEAFHKLNEAEIEQQNIEIEPPVAVSTDSAEQPATSDEADPREAQKQKWKEQAAERAKKAAEFGTAERKINKNTILGDLWDQVYCTLTDGVDNRVYNILGEWSGNRRYPFTHVMPSAAASAFLPKGFKAKGGYNDIIVFSPSADISIPFADDEAEKRRNKKNRKQDFDYAKEVAEVYHLPYAELEDAFVLYVPKSKFLNAETLDEKYFLQLFPDDLIMDYLNNSNLKTELENGLDFPYDIKAYLNARIKRNERDDFIKADPDLSNWVIDTTDEMFSDRFGVRSGDNLYTEKEKKLFDLLLDKTIKVAGVILDQIKQVTKTKDKKAE